MIGGMVGCAGSSKENRSLMIVEIRELRSFTQT
jgi:hypothetical protein